VSIIGTHGVPAKYGGFETLAENLAENLKSDFKFIIFCNYFKYTSEEKKLKYNYRRIFIPFNASGWQSYLYDFFSFFYSLFTTDVIIYLGPTSGYLTFFNLFFRKNIITNYGGLNEWERPRYNKFEKLLFKINIYFASKLSTTNVVDNLVLQKSLLEVFNSNSVVIRYGGDHVLHKKSDTIDTKFLNSCGLKANNYFLVIARAQKDSMFDLLIDSFKSIKTEIPLVIVSNWNVNSYGRKIKSKKFKNVIMIDAIYDSEKLNQIRRNCYVYIHSHSFCGTAPSLVEAMSFPLPIFCYDVKTNRETTANKSLYFKSKSELIDLINKSDTNILNKIIIDMKKLSIEKYRWHIIAKKYCNLIKNQK
tara:strand:- start:154 stop:1239 length:1086 start_codon:yes stop_codon:yes gene_type:complete